ncbi:type II toxin-antitoxin system RelE/ParE family toxin [uncultured Herbaspirillum sp.]|uniref:type II toxin-antitoxin system RelE/ParE family toxin n=1 Tax=uncultured Herbaspirillum sp. TaxID=160236 RepID=UPI002586A535|nr:type II toxin-antitoxin system RelE/ParE family toxin [uncultured Herbaspirillum sp.]
MIHSFCCSDTEMLFNSHPVQRFKNIERVARRKLLMIHAARDLAALRVPPGNRLELLKGDRKGQHSIRISDQWRICFKWMDEAAHDVAIVDYH